MNIDINKEIERKAQRFQKAYKHRWLVTVLALIGIFEMCFGIFSINYFNDKFNCNFNEDKIAELVEAKKIDVQSKEFVSIIKSEIEIKTQQAKNEIYLVVGCGVFFIIKGFLMILLSIYFFFEYKNTFILYSYICNLGKKLEENKEV